MVHCHIFLSNYEGNTQKNHHFLLLKLEFNVIFVYNYHNSNNNQNDEIRNNENNVMKTEKKLLYNKNTFV